MEAKGRQAETSAYRRYDVFYTRKPSLNKFQGD